MKAKVRYLASLTVIFWAFFLSWLYFKRVRSPQYLEPWPSAEEIQANEQWFNSLKDSAYTELNIDKETLTNFDCNMDTCWQDNPGCAQGPPYLHHVHGGGHEEDNGGVGFVFRKVLRALRESPNHTDDPERACIFIAAVDTLDRDPLSEGGFVHNVQAKLDALPLWRGGRNHIVFNFYSGTYPNYSAADLGFDPGFAVMARASAASGKESGSYRRDFDISLPLVHAKHPLRAGPTKEATAPFPPARNDGHLLAFKVRIYIYYWRDIDKLYCIKSHIL